MMRRTFAILFVIFLLSVPVQLSDGSESAVDVGLVISEVDPSCEAVTVCNRGSAEKDLKGHVITDGEGTLTFVGSVRLGPEQSITVSKESGTVWFNSRDNVVTFKSDLLEKKGNFILADSGDEVILSYRDKIVDSVCYGKSQGVEGWYGDPVPISSGKYLKRLDCADTDSSSDWISVKPGWTCLTDEPSFPAQVAPFSFPECGGAPILGILSTATESIDVSIYLLTSNDAVSAMCQAIDSGVKVRVLAEGRPLGSDISSEITLLRLLEQKGADVRLINYEGSENGRYPYLHSKYALVDGNIAVVTSENWTSGNFGGSGNRGWGVAIRSEGYVAYMKEVFENDFSTEWGDVQHLGKVYPDAGAYMGLAHAEFDTSELSYVSATVTPAVSPDNSFGRLRSFMYSAEHRLYSEQMDLGSSMSSVKDDTPVSWMAAAAMNGVDTKFVLDCSQSNSAVHEKSINMIRSTTSVEAVGWKGGWDFGLVHNKGVIADDKVWVGSVNWTENSFLRNRECAVIIDSEEVSDTFAELFLHDFGSNIYTIRKNGLGLCVDVVDTPDGKAVRMSVDGPEGYGYRWSLGNGDFRETVNSAVLFKAPDPGTYLAYVVIEGTDVMESVEYVVPGGSPSRDGGHTSYLLIAVALGVLGIGIAVPLWKDRTKKKMGRARYGTAGPRRNRASSRNVQVGRGGQRSRVSGRKRSGRGRFGR